jgi:hypothetical protein
MLRRGRRISELGIAEYVASDRVRPPAQGAGCAAQCVFLLKTVELRFAGCTMRRRYVSAHLLRSLRALVLVPGWTGGTNAVS